MWTRLVDEKYQTTAWCEVALLVLHSVGLTPSSRYPY